METRNLQQQQLQRTGVSRCRTVTSETREDSLAVTAGLERTRTHHEHHERFVSSGGKLWTCLVSSSNCSTMRLLFKSLKYSGLSDIFTPHEEEIDCKRSAGDQHFLVWCRRPFVGLLTWISERRALQDELCSCSTAPQLVCVTSPPSQVALNYFAPLVTERFTSWTSPLRRNVKRGKTKWQIQSSVAAAWSEDAADASLFASLPSELHKVFNFIKMFNFILKVWQEAEYLPCTEAKSRKTRRK